MDGNIIKKHESGIRLVVIMLITGIVLLAVSIAVLTENAHKQTMAVCNETFDFVKRRIAKYENYSANDKIKSLVRLLDKTEELSRCVSEHDSVSQEFFDNYAQEQRIDCIYVFDENMNVTFQSDKDEMISWEDKLNKEDISSIIQYPKKKYTIRVERDGEVYDFAAVSKRDEPGIILTVSHKRDILPKDKEITMDSLLEDFTFKLNGVVVVTDKEKVLSSNFSKLQHKTVHECKMLYTGVFEADRNHLIKLKFNGNRWYGSKIVTDGYNLYAFFPEKSVYSSLRNTIIIGIFSYIAVCIIILYIRYEINRANMKQIEKQLRLISSISGIYVFAMVINLKNNKCEVVKADEYKKNVVDVDKGAEAVLKSYAKNCITEQYQEEFIKFTELETVSQRLGYEKYITCTAEGKDGRWYLLLLVPQQQSQKGAKDSVILLCRDITMDKLRELAYESDLKHSVEQAERANVAKTDFLRRMSHDIRTPINGIRGMIDISRHYIGDENRQEECRDKILAASGFLLDLVNNILDMNKLESGEIKLEEKPFDLKKLIEDIISVIEVQAAEHNVTLKVEKTNSFYRYLIGSPLHLRQVLQNIMSNAVKYNKENGSITISMREIFSDEDKILFEFKCTDTGIGMTEEFQKHAFEPFAQESESARTAYFGTGLGLAIAKELTEKMGGVLEFKSKYGVGTTFTMTMNLRKDKAHVEPDIIEKETNEADIHDIKILLVEDNELNMEIAEFTLENAGAHVIKAWNGKEAVDIFLNSKTDEFDIILMDIMMPVMNGIDATKAIRAGGHPQSKAIPIFAMTANAFSDDIERSLAVGINEHLSKPLDGKKLVEAISRYIYG